MQLSLGMKSDPVEYRYSYDWLFDLLGRCQIPYLQLGSSFEFYTVDDAYFLELRELAERKGIRIKSCFTSHRELGGFLTNNPHLEKVARQNYERYIHVGSLLGADYVGSNPGAVYRDQMAYKPRGIECYLTHMKDLMQGWIHQVGIDKQDFLTAACKGYSQICSNKALSFSVLSRHNRYQPFIV